MEKLPFSYLLSYKLLVPFITQIKDLMALHEKYTWVGTDRGDTDELKSKAIIGVSNISKITTVQKKPMILLKRSPIQRDRSVLNNISESYNLWDDEKPYGEIIRTGVNITILTELPLVAETLGSYLFWELEWNKEKFREQGITDAYVNYMSSVTPAENYPGSEVDAWQLGINIDVTIHEKYFLLPFKTEKAIKEFELIKNLAFRDMKFEVPVN